MMNSGKRERKIDVIQKSEMTKFGDVNTHTAKVVVAAAAAATAANSTTRTLTPLAFLSTYMR